jgi:hypothetical protein
MPAGKPKVRFTILSLLAFALTSLQAALRVETGQGRFYPKRNWLAMAPFPFSATLTFYSEGHACCITLTQSPIQFLVQPRLRASKPVNTSEISVRCQERIDWSFFWALKTHEIGVILASAFSDLTILARSLAGLKSPSPVYSWWSSALYGYYVITDEMRSFAAATRARMRLPVSLPFF